MRKSCLNCIRKHISAAIILDIETRMGYPKHAWFVVGNLVEAEAESIMNYPILSKRIRIERQKYMRSINLDKPFPDKLYNPKLEPLIDLATKYVVEWQKLNLNNQK